MKRNILLLLLVGCVDERKPLTGTQSIEVELVSPTNPGDVMNRLPDTQRMVVVNLRAKNANGELDTSFNDTMSAYAQFLGTLTPQLGDPVKPPLATVDLVDGVAMNVMVSLPSAYGPTTLWFDNGKDNGPDYQFGAISGTSPTLWYRDPFIRDLQRPEPETSPDALIRTPLTDKQIRVGESRHGANGALVVTSTFAQGYTVSDVQCAAGGETPTPPCTAGDYDHVMVFTFSAPRDQFGRPLVVGEVIREFNGGLTEFNALTEVGFPRTFTHKTEFEQEPCANYPMCSTALVPPPVLFDVDWFGPHLNGMVLNPDGRINFERNEAGLIDIRNAKVCPLDDGPDGDYTKYKQWSIDPVDPPPDDMRNDCGSNRVINLVTAGSDFTTDPRTLVGKTLTRVVGTVRPAFTIWIVYPRGKDDIAL